MTEPPPEHLVTGSGLPSTVFVAGLAQTLGDIRAFGSGVTGTRSFVELVVPTVASAVDAVSSVSDEVDASQALGVSLGATAVLAAAARQPDRYTKIVVALPGAVFDDHSEPAQQALQALRDAFVGHDQIAMTQALLEIQPASVRSKLPVSMWARRQADVVLGLPLGPLLDDVLSGAAAHLAAQVPLATMRTPVLVLAQADDDVHPLSAAQQLAHVLPNAQLVVSDLPWVWSARERLREVVSGFLAT
ncbi:MAG: alpha/beta hydrolase [Actinomycetes bacterium]